MAYSHSIRATLNVKTVVDDYILFKAIVNIFVFICKNGCKFSFRWARALK